MNLVAVLLLTAAYLLSMILLSFVYRKAQRWSGVLPCVALSVAELLVLVALVGVRNRDYSLPWAAGWSVAGAAAFLICTALALVLYRRRYRRMLSGNSIQESTDKVPLGLCFYYPDGVPILINARMQHLAERVTGSAITNAEVFCRRVDGKTIEADGRYYRFCSADMDCNGGTVRRLWAMDITDLHRLAMALDAENAARKEINQRLRAYSRQVEKLTREREVLKAKMDIHDKMGRMLLETKIFLEDGNGDYTSIANRWHRTLTVFTTRFWRERTPADVQALEQMAAAMHLQLQMNGMPEQAVFLEAVRECMTNAVRHAGAGAMYVQATPHRIVITNNGKPPERPITEGGGLSDLRQKVEQQGGTMTVESAPVFRLQIDL